MKVTYGLYWFNLIYDDYKVNEKIDCCDVESCSNKLSCDECPLDDTSDKFLLFKDFNK